MSGGSGGAQMPMASNRGQQQQMGMQPQMGQMPMGGMRPQMGGGQLFPPGGGQGRRFDFEGGGMGMIDQQRQAQDQYAMQLAQQAQQDQMGNMDPMGGMPMQTNQPYAMSGQPMGGGQQMFGSQGIQDLIRAQYAQSLMNGPSMSQLVNGPNPQVQRDIRPTNMQPSAIGSQTAYRPSMGAIDGRALTDKLDITKRRQMNELPGSIQNTLPPALKRPTQGGMRGVRV